MPHGNQCLRYYPTTFLKFCPKILSEFSPNSFDSAIVSSKKHLQNIVGR